MSFINPNGLLFLIGIPILIILYILKRKYAERAIASSFIWRKSMHLLKKNVRWRRLLRYILFMLQLLIIAVVSLLIAKPVFNSDSIGLEYYIILDGSASMLAETDEETRFSRAVDEIVDLSENMLTGSKMTVILAADSASCVVRSSDSQKTISKVLNGLECGYEKADITGALELAFDESEGSENYKIIIYSDKSYDDSGDVLCVNMANGEWNAAITSLTESTRKGKTTVTATVESYGLSASLTLALYVDGSLTDAKIAECESGVPVEIVWEELELGDYEEITVSFEAEDSITLDNSYSYINDTSSEKDVLIISETSYFLENVLEAVIDCDITTATSLDETDEEGNAVVTLSGYDLYIFDGIFPDTLPDDGAVWIINPDTSTTIADISLGEAYEGGTLTLSHESISEAYNTITDYVDGDEIVASKYTELIYAEGYETIFTLGDSPVILAKDDDSYQKTVVFLFDIHDSNLPLLLDFPVLISNMAEYSMPPVLESRDFTSGDSVTINAASSEASVTVYDEEGTQYDVATASSRGIFTADEPGVYTVSQITLSDTSVVSTEDKFFVHMDLTESDIYAEGASLALEDSTEIEDTDEELSFWEKFLSADTNLWPYIAIALLIILMAEWWLYYSEEF